MKSWSYWVLKDQGPNAKNADNYMYCQKLRCKWIPPQRESILSILFPKKIGILSLLRSM